MWAAEDDSGTAVDVNRTHRLGRAAVAAASKAAGLFGMVVAMSGRVLEPARTSSMAMACGRARIRDIE